MGVIPMAGYAIVNFVALMLESVWISLGMPWKNNVMRGFSRAELNGAVLMPKSKGGMAPLN
jgi:hypothetical protein